MTSVAFSGTVTVMADLFPEIRRRAHIARAYERWKVRRPWRWLPSFLRPMIFRRCFAQSEVS